MIFLAGVISSCSQRAKFKQDKIQFRDRLSLSEKKETRDIVSAIFKQDTFKLKYLDIGCYHYFYASVNLSAINDSFKITYDTVDTHTQMLKDFSYVPRGGIDFSINKTQLDTIEYLFSIYANREYKMHSTSNQTYELIGCDTSVSVENNYSFEGNPLLQLDRILKIEKMKLIAQERSKDSSALDVYWSSF